MDAALERESYSNLIFLNICVLKIVGFWTAMRVSTEAIVMVILSAACGLLAHIKLNGQLWPNGLTK